MVGTLGNPVLPGVTTGGKLFDELFDELNELLELLDVAIELELDAIDLELLELMPDDAIEELLERELLVDIVLFDDELLLTLDAALLVETLLDVREELATEIADELLTLPLALELELVATLAPLHAANAKQNGARMNRKWLRNRMVEMMMFWCCMQYFTLKLFANTGCISESISKLACDHCPSNMGTIFLCY